MGISSRRGATPRCPFASVHRCPRYYQSLSLLGRFGNTPIAADQDAALLERWKKSDLWPVVDEQAVGVVSFGSYPTIFSNFCPEVAYDTFGIFAEGFGRAGDTFDTELRHERLSIEHAKPDDYRWNWNYASPLHYTECPLYAPLVGPVPTQPITAEPSLPKSRLARFITSRPVRWLSLIGGGVAAVAKYGDSLRKLWDLLRR